MKRYLSIFSIALACGAFSAPALAHEIDSQKTEFILPAYDLENDDFDLDTLIQEYHQGVYDDFLNPLYENPLPFQEELQNMYFGHFKNNMNQFFEILTKTHTIQVQFQEDLRALKETVKDPELHHHLQVVCDNFLSPEEEERVEFYPLFALNLKPELTKEETQLQQIYVWNLAAKTSLIENKNTLKRHALIALKMFDEMQKVVDASKDKASLQLIYSEKNLEIWKKTLTLTLNQEGWSYLEKVRVKADPSEEESKLIEIFKKRQQALMQLTFSQVPTQ